MRDRAKTRDVTHPTRMDSLTIQILQSYFETVLTLEGYLRKLTGKNAAASFLTHETDTLSYRKLLHESVVVSRRGIFADKTLEPKSPLGYLPEVTTPRLPADQMSIFYYRSLTGRRRVSCVPRRSRRMCSLRAIEWSVLLVYLEPY